MKKLITILCICLCAPALYAQKPNWQNLDLKKDSVFGISTERAYAELLKGKKAQKVTVAVIDAGIDTNHVDLRNVLWKQKNLRGWSYLGSSKGNVSHESLELTRMVKTGRKRFTDLAIQKGDTSGLAAFRKLERMYNVKLLEAKRSYENALDFKKIIDSIFTVINVKDTRRSDIVDFVATTVREYNIRSLLINSIKSDEEILPFRKEEVDGRLARAKNTLDYSLNIDFDPRDLIGDRKDNLMENNYGTADVMGPDATHGTHVAGIIGAIRGNGIGIDGVADHVNLITIRAVPDGDERDKDIANAIIYAVDHGAKVVNMSFGKPFSPNKEIVDRAVRYAMEKDVLLIHAAGNDSKDLDIELNFPNRNYADGKGSAAAWIEVGASGPKDNFQLAASFSNYGKTTVDVFAPGVKIYSAVPGSKYAYLDGTSMACPVVAGLAALIRSYFPGFTAVEVKEIIMRSAVKVSHNVSIFKQGRNQTVPFSDLSISGGVVNAYEAIKLAQEMSVQKK